MCIIISLITSLALPSNVSSKTSNKIIKQPMCSMKKLYYYTEWIEREHNTKKRSIKKKYWKQAKDLKNKILKSNKKVYRVKYKNKSHKENVIMTFATMYARYTPYEENEPDMYKDFEYCEVTVSKFKKSLKIAKTIKKNK